MLTNTYVLLLLNLTQSNVACCPILILSKFPNRLLLWHTRRFA